MVLLIVLKLCQVQTIVTLLLFTFVFQNMHLLVLLLVVDPFLILMMHFSYACVLTIYLERLSFLVVMIWSAHGNGAVAQWLGS